MYLPATLATLPRNALSLLGLKQELRLGRAVENYEFFGQRRFLVLGADTGEPRSTPARIVTGHKEEGGGLEFFRRAIRGGPKQHHTVDFTRLRRNRGIPGSRAARAAADH